jgi:hypothetical protein
MTCSFSKKLAALWRILCGVYMISRNASQVFVCFLNPHWCYTLVNINVRICRIGALVYVQKCRIIPDAMMICWLVFCLLFQVSLWLILLLVRRFVELCGCYGVSVMLFLFLFWLDVWNLILLSGRVNLLKVYGLSLHGVSYIQIYFSWCIIKILSVGANILSCGLLTRVVLHFGAWARCKNSLP